ncbi:hypothetical protein CCY99_01390 [Helicobacter sp. 16-1353]|uniref:hypothetical protein n=1 Tax=Helicobacter sp. 16-1353 TaxID=2004996 RepID=UPI000DCBE84A|nr:hypothetical protein [Helicobacter sp. 16-1353]RAX54839.1 hypothetical protein CCY99_01390 [Helicobacter sp. 16-1353]
MLKFLSILFICVFANAHSLKVFATEEGGFIHIKTYFSGNSPCKECSVKFIKNGRIFENLKTDENGILQAKLIENNFEILVDGGLGHEKKIMFSSGIQSNERIESSISYIYKFAIAFGSIIIIFTLLYIIKKRK